MSRSLSPGPTASAIGASSTPTRPAPRHRGTSATVPEVLEPISVTVIGPSEEDSDLEDSGPEDSGADPLVPSLRSMAVASDLADARPVSGLFSGFGLEPMPELRAMSRPNFDPL